jgi:hypothetical protein
MAVDLPKKLAQARARVEAGRAGAELWFNKQVKKAKTTKDFDETLLGYVFDVFFLYAQEFFNVGLELKWPAAEVRERIEKALDGVVDEAFASKHYSRNSSGSHLDRAAFRHSATNQIRFSDEWGSIQEKLRELAEWEAAGGDGRYLDRGNYPFDNCLTGPSPRGFSNPRDEWEYWRKAAWKGYHAQIRSAAQRGMAPTSRNEKLAHAIGGLAYDLAVVKANEILDRGLRSESAIETYRDEVAEIQEGVESAWRASRERLAVSFEDDTEEVKRLAQPFHRVRDDLRRLLHEPTDIEGNGADLAQLASQVPTKGRKRGPKPDYETAGRVAEVIARVAPDGDSRSMLDEVCDAAPKKTLEWEDIEFSFIGDHDAEARIADTRARKVNYKEIAGFEDRRTGKPSQLWAVLRVFGSLPDGTMPDDARNGKEWEAIRKKIERTSKALRKHFGMTGDPLPYIRGTGYRARIKIRPAPD